MPGHADQRDTAGAPVPSVPARAHPGPARRARLASRPAVCAPHAGTSTPYRARPLNGLKEARPAPLFSLASTGLASSKVDGTSRSRGRSSRRRGSRWSGRRPCRREAVLTTSPEAMASPASGRASQRDEGLARGDPDHAPRGRPFPRPPLSDRKCGADGALGVVLVRGRRPEERHHSVADELLDGAAVPLELVSQGAGGTDGGWPPRPPGPAIRRAR